MSDDASFDLEVAAATLRGGSSDLQALLKALASQLAEPLGQRLRVERAGGLLRKSDEVKSLSAAIGNEQFEATVRGSSVSCVIAKSSGGIRIRSETVGMDEWLQRLLQALQAEAVHSESARLALEKMVIGGP